MTIADEAVKRPLNLSVQPDSPHTVAVTISFPTPHDNCENPTYSLSYHQVDPDGAEHLERELPDVKPRETIGGLPPWTEYAFKGTISCLRNGSEILEGQIFTGEGDTQSSLFNLIQPKKNMHLPQFFLLFLTKRLAMFIWI